MLSFLQMDDGPRFFTIDEANALLPALRMALGDLSRLRAELEQAIVAAGGAEAAAAILRSDERPEAGREDAAARLQQVAAEVAAAVGRINGLGCVLKDVEAGLVDFYSIYDDEPVFLCWQLGEPAVAHWHPLDAGFSAREPIEGIEIEPPRFFN